MTERIVPAAIKMISRSDLNGMGISTQTIKTQCGQAYAFPFSVSELRFELSRIEAILAKFDEENSSE